MISSTDFREHPLFQAAGFGAPTRFEADIADCEVVEGAIPSDLRGRFYRMACDFQYRPPENDWFTGFNGDGHISMFTFDGSGKVAFKSRYIMTPRLKAEREARKRLFGVYRNRLTDHPSVMHLPRTLANTHIYYHAGKLLALKEDSPAFAIDPLTLEAKGLWSFHGYDAATFSGHPKVDPVSGEMICYGFQAKGDLTRDIFVYTVDEAGFVAKKWRFKAPWVPLVHDVAITQKHIILPVVGIKTSLEQLKAGQPMWDLGNWDLSGKTMCAVIPRDGESKDIRWFEGPSRLTLHFLNAVTEGERISMELPVSKALGAPPQIRRWTFDLSSKSNYQFGEDPMVISDGLLPRMDDRYLSLPYEYGYVGCRAGSGDVGRAVYVKFDIHKGVVSTYRAESEIGSFQECSFAPRTKSGAEGDGYIMGIGSNTAEGESELHIINADRMEPVAVIRMPFRLREGTHTNWVPSWQLAV